MLPMRCLRPPLLRWLLRPSYLLLNIPILLYLALVTAVFPVISSYCIIVLRLASWCAWSIPHCIGVKWCGIRNFKKESKKRVQKEMLTLARLSVHSPIIGSVIFKTTHRSLLGVWYIPLRKVQFESYPRVHGAKRPVTDSMREYLNLIPICQKKIFIWKWRPPCQI